MAKRSAWAWLVAAVVAGATLGCGDDSSIGGDGGPPDSRPPDGGPPDGAAACVYPTVRALNLPNDTASSVLRGMSRNASTTCTTDRGTGGPEDFYTLHVGQRIGVQLATSASIDTALAIRRVCDDPLSEIACNDNYNGPWPPPGDGGVGNPQNAFIRTVLDPGDYFVMVDQIGFGVGGAYTLTLNSFTPPPNVDCASAALVMDGTVLRAQNLDDARDRITACVPFATGRVLYYAATIPAGYVLRANAQQTGPGAGPLLLRLLGGCGASSCLADSATLGSLHYANSGSSAQAVILAVGGYMDPGPLFDLYVTIRPAAANVSCSTPKPLSDGLILRGEDLTEAGDTTVACLPSFNGPQLYYSATLLPGQPMVVTLQPAGPWTGGPPISRVLSMCGASSCLADGFSSPPPAGGTGVRYVNGSSGTQNVILSIGAAAPGQGGLFDLYVSMPLPPGSIQVMPTSGLVTTESGGTASFIIGLGTPVTANVSIALSSSNPAEGTVSPTSVTFTPQNWNTPQTITVTGVDDSVADGNQAYQIITAPASSADPRYNGLNAADVSVTNRDNEATVSVLPTSGLVTTESGGTASFAMQLNRQPTADVVIALASSNPGEGTVAPTSVTFTSQNWNTPQTVTVTGVDDQVIDGNQAYSIVTAAAVSSDSAYSGYNPPDVSCTNLDNDLTTTPPQIISGGRSCDTNASNTGRKVAIDAAGNVYVAMRCSGEVYIATSLNYGQSYGAPVATGIIGAQEVAVLGGAAGNAYVAAVGGSSLWFTRTTASGASWTSPVTLDTTVQRAVVSMASYGSNLYISVGASGGIRVWRNGSAGSGTFQPTDVPMLQAFWDVLADPSTGDVWLAGDTPSYHLFRSTDGAATFGSELNPPGNAMYSDWAIGGGKMFVTGSSPDTLDVIPLAAPTTGTTISGLPPTAVMQSRALTANGTGTAFFVEQAASGAIVLGRLLPGATAVSDLRTIAPSGAMPGVVALTAASGVVVVYTVGSDVLVTNQVY